MGPSRKHGPSVLASVRDPSPWATSTATGMRTWRSPTSFPTPSRCCWAKAMGPSRSQSPSRPARAPLPWPWATSTATGMRIWRSPTLALTPYQVLLGNGDGTFQAPLTFTAGGRPASVAVGDFNGDGKPDLAVANQGISPPGNVSVLLGNGDGTFQAPLTVAPVNIPTSVAV